MNPNFLNELEEKYGYIRKKIRIPLFEEKEIKFANDERQSIKKVVGIKETIGLIEKDSDLLKKKIQKTKDENDKSKKKHTEENEKRERLKDYRIDIETSAGMGNIYSGGVSSIRFNKVDPNKIDVISNNITSIFTTPKGDNADRINILPIKTNLWYEYFPDKERDYTFNFEYSLMGDTNTPRINYNLTISNLTLRGIFDIDNFNIVLEWSGNLFQKILSICNVVMPIEYRNRNFILTNIEAERSITNDIDYNENTVQGHYYTTFNNNFQNGQLNNLEEYLSTLNIYEMPITGKFSALMATPFGQLLSWLQTFSNKMENLNMSGSIVKYKPMDLLNPLLVVKLDDLNNTSINPNLRMIQTTGFVNAFFTDCVFRPFWQCLVVMSANGIWSNKVLVSYEIKFSDYNTGMDTWLYNLGVNEHKFFIGMSETRETFLREDGVTKESKVYVSRDRGDKLYVLLADQFVRYLFWILSEYEDDNSERKWKYEINLRFKFVNLSNQNPGLKQRVLDISNLNFYENDFPPLYQKLTVNVQMTGRGYSAYVNENCINKWKFTFYYKKFESTINDPQRMRILFEQFKNNELYHLTKINEILTYLKDENIALIIIKDDLLGCTVTKRNFDHGMVLFPSTQTTRPHVEYTNGEQFLKFLDFMRNNKWLGKITDNKSHHFPFIQKTFAIFKNTKRNKIQFKDEINLYIDIETFMTKNREAYLICCCGYEDKVFEGLDCIAQFFQYLEFITMKKIRNSRLVLWAHNGSRFDFLYFLPFISNGQIKGSRTNIKELSFNLNGVEVVTRDFCLTIQGSLKRIAESFKTLNKLDNEVILKVNSMEDFNNNRCKIIEYCNQDCKVLSEIISKFKCEIEQVLGKPIPNSFVSSASLANFIFNNYYLDRTLYGLRPSSYINVKKSYFGGYTQVYAKEMNEGYYYDINSSYPSCMIGQVPFRIDNNEYFQTEVFPEYENYKDKFALLYHFEYFTLNERCNSPLIPTKTKHGNFYYLQNKECFVWDHSIQYIFENDYHKSFKLKGYYKFQTSDIYKKYIETFYELKSKADNEIKKTFAKLLLNSTYGKTGQKSYNKLLLMSNENLESYIKEANSLTNIEKIVISSDKHQFIELKSNELVPNHIGSLVFIASFITSKARLKLIKMIDLIESQGGNVYYCDTDSIFTDFKLPEGFVDKQELGKWKLECEIKRGKFYGAKSYIYETKNGETFIKLKGVPKEYIKGKENEIWGMNEKGIEFFIETSWKRRFGFVENSNLTKKIKPTLNRRVFLNDNRSIPLFS